MALIRIVPVDYPDRAIIINRLSNESQRKLYGQARCSEIIYRAASSIFLDISSVTS